MIGVTTSSETNEMKNGIRPVNLQTDLLALADLIELSFRDKMDESGRAAIREMRYLSKLGFGLNLMTMTGLSDLALGISRGFVKILDGDLVGNVSIYPANWRKELGTAWMIANVSTHPNYRQRGIARELMAMCIDHISEKNATDAILQVDYDNHPAIHLYETLGFVRERAFTKWTRSSMVSTPQRNRELDGIFFTKPRRGDWRAEYNLAQETRPNEKGGIGWLKPLHIKDFQPSFMRSLGQLLSLGDKEKLIIRDDNSSDLLASLWIERSLALSRTNLTMMIRPETDIRFAEVLLANAIRRYRTSSFVLEHPHDDVSTTELLSQYRFRPYRTVWHMRYSY